LKSQGVRSGIVEKKMDRSLLKALKSVTIPW